MENPKQVVIDRGIYFLGMKYASGDKPDQEPRWESSFDGRSLVIGHEGESFDISSVDDMEFILRELQERLQLDYEVEKIECKCGFECFYDRSKYPEALECCPSCSIELST